MSKTWEDFDVDELVERLPRWAGYVWENGPRAGQQFGRSAWKLSRMVAEKGTHSEAECLALVQDYDRRYGGFHRHEDGEARLRDLVADAYSKRGR